LLFIAAIAYGFLLLTGKLAKRFTGWFDWLITGRNRSASVIWLAIQVIKQELPLPRSFWRQLFARASVRAGP
jgi:hypothetical protein